MKLALLLLFLQPGAPCLYYGTEAGLAGGPEEEHSTGPGPACREAFPWEERWPVDLSPWIAQLTDLRRRCPDLREGAHHWSAVGNDGLRGNFSDLQVLINRSVEASLPIDATKQVIWSSTGVTDLQELGPQTACLQRL